MKKLLPIVVAALGLIATHAFGATAYRYNDSVTTLRGDAVGGASVYVYTANTTTLVDLYSGGSTGHPETSNPVTTDGYGRYHFYVAPGTYDLRITGANLTTYTIEDVRIFSDTGYTYNVLDYGAIPDDDLDDTGAIQDAVDAAEAATSGRVVFPYGEYTVDAETEIVSGSNMTFDLTSGATLKASANADGSYRILRIYGASNVRVLGGTFIGDRDDHVGSSGESGMCISILGSDNVFIDGVTLEKAWGDGLYIGVGADTTMATNITVANCTVRDNRRQGCSITHAENVKFIGCTFSNTAGTNPQCGVDIEPNTGQSVTSVSFSGCHFSDNVGDGILVSGTAGAVDGVVVDGCVFTGNASLGAAQASIKLYAATNVSLLGNTILDSDMQGIRADTTSSVTISGNAVSNIQTHGIYVKNSDNVSVSGNTVKGASLAANNTSYGIYVLGASDLIQVSGNTVALNTDGNNQKHALVVEASTRVNCVGNSLDSISAKFYHSGTISSGVLYGTGTPESAVVAPPGFVHLNYSGSGPSLYVKDSGASSAGWGAMPSVRFGSTAPTDTTGRRGTMFWFDPTGGDTLKVYTGTPDWRWQALH